MWWKIIVGIAVLVVALAFARMIVPDFFNFGGGSTTTIIHNTTEVFHNATP